MGPSGYNPEKEGERENIMRRSPVVVQAAVVGSVVVLVLWLAYHHGLPIVQQQPALTCPSLNSIKALMRETLREEVWRGGGGGGEGGGARKSKDDPTLPIIYIITPTFKRQEQIPELTRLAQTLMNVPNIHWLVADDSDEPNQVVKDYLAITGITHTYLTTPMPEKYRKQSAKPKGVANRNAGVTWVKQHATEGVVYFADDDNTYDIRVFEEMRYTKRVSMFPVGLVTGAGLSSPVVAHGKFQGWYDGWIANRKFPVDMAGFAVSVEYLHQVPTAEMPYVPGYEEDGFLKSLKIKPEELEFKADDCTKVYVWHTQTKKNGPSNRDLLDAKYDGTNLRVIQNTMTFKAPPA